MIQVNGCEFKNIAQPIYVNRKRVKEVWVNGIMVYPELEIDPLLQYAMYFKFGSNVLSKYSSEPVDAYGAYIKFDDFVFGIYRVAFVVTGTGRNIYRQAIVTYRGDVNGGSAGITYVPYISLGGVIVADGFSHSDIPICHPGGEQRVQGLLQAFDCGYAVSAAHRTGCLLFMPGACAGFLSCGYIDREERFF